MSSSGRRQRGINVFENNFQGTAKEASDQIFSGQDHVESLGLGKDVRQVAKPISIFKIYPDYKQPRRAIPSTIRDSWSGEPEALHQLFDSWVKFIELEKGERFDLRAHLNQAHLTAGLENDDLLDQSLPIETALLSLIQLANSIRQIGLTNPITVANDGRHFTLETGERRWLAYHLLNIYFPDEDWASIPARQVDQFDVWRQATENSARADLNAIGKARQLAILMMDLLVQDHGAAFQTFEEIVHTGGHEREYYAQVADGTVFPIPRGKSERLLDATGFKSPAQIRQYRMILRLSNELWDIADDYSLTEREIRDSRFPSVTQVTPRHDSVTRGNASRAVLDDPYNPFLEDINRKRRGKIWAYASKLDLLSNEQKAKALEDIEAEKRWLEELERALRSRSDLD